MKFAISSVLIALAAAAAPAPASSADYPSRPIRIVAVDPAGGPLDRLLRQVGSRLSTATGQPVIVDNRPGGEGVIGLEACARAPGDGYTFCGVSAGPASIMLNLRKLSIDPASDLVPLTPMVSVAAVVYANPKLPASNLRELLALAKDRQGALTYASFGNGSVPHIVFEWMKAKSGADILHVPYQGAAPALTAVMAGNTDLGLIAAGAASTLLQSGKLKPIAVQGQGRSALMPEVPTLGEQGLPYDLVTWFGLLAPKGVSDEIRDKIAAQVAAIIRSPEFKSELDQNGYTPFTLRPREFADYLAKERKRYGQVISEARIRIE